MPNVCLKYTTKIQKATYMKKCARNLVGRIKLHPLSSCDTQRRVASKFLHTYIHMCVYTRPPVDTRTHSGSYDLYKKKIFRAVSS